MGEGPCTKTLEKLWKSGREGTLCPLEQAKTWGFREAQRARGEEENHQDIAQSVVKVGGGRPGRDAVRKFFEKVDADPDWYPGKRDGERPGPKPALTAQQQNNIAQCAMAHKKTAGLEPTYNTILSKCPGAVKNPETGLPVDKKRVITFANPIGCFGTSHVVCGPHAILAVSQSALVRAPRDWGAQETARAPFRQPASGQLPPIAPGVNRRVAMLVLLRSTTSSATSASTRRRTSAGSTNRAPPRTLFCRPGKSSELSFILV
jgi:hypothetical protein